MLDYQKINRNLFGATKAIKTEGRDGEEHVNLRNWQMRQPIQNMNGQRGSRITKYQYETIRSITFELAQKM